MCGICGIYNFDPQQKVDSKLLKRMCDVVKHRGPDDEGIYINNNIGLGHRRLSIIDLAQGHQPMYNEDKNICVVFNGEIYNYMPLRNELIDKGHIFTTNSDTEVIVHLYEEKGEEFAGCLRGMFALGLWDEKREKLILARDRLGKKPVHYFRDKEKFIFASEIKSILEDKEIKREINYDAIDDFFAFLCVPAPKTIFKGIYKLPPAHLLICTPDQFSIREYWDFNFGNTQKLKEEYYKENLIQLLTDAVKCRLMSEVPLGAFLSGGIDSSCVVAIMSQLSEKPVITSSIGFDERAFDELKFAQVVSSQFKTNHHEHVVRPNALEILSKLVYHFDEPFADSSAIPTYYVSKMAKEEVTVALSGDGGDEFFAGYNSYRYHISQDRIRRMLPTFIKRYILKPMLNRYPKSWRARKYLTSISSSFEESLIRSKFACDYSMKQELYTHEFKSQLANYDPSIVLEPYLKRSKEWDILSRAQYIDAKTYLPDDILVKVDRMSMAVSLEVRAPFLDHELIEFVSTIPPNLRLKGGISKYILKKAMEGLIPSEILRRGKKGFSVPLNIWLKKDLKSMVEEVLLVPKAFKRGYFNPEYVQRMWHDYQQNGTKESATQLWCLLMFELWHRTFIDEDQILS
ncbi:MAG: asparagine synthase (glutamine-hydrolyzing) [bacterium]